MGINKALCKLSDHETFLTSIVSSIRAISQCAKIVVVVGAQAQTVMDIHKNLDVHWVENANWKITHMLDSFLCGLSVVPAGIDVLHWPVDCIGIHTDDLLNLLSTPCAAFSMLAFQGIPGHPVRIHASKIPWFLENALKFHSLREIFTTDSCQIINAKQEALMNCNNPQILADFIASHTK